MADSARPVSNGIVHVDTGDEPGIGKGAMRLLVFAIAGADPARHAQHLKLLRRCGARPRRYKKSVRSQGAGAV